MQQRFRTAGAIAAVAITAFALSACAGEASPAATGAPSDAPSTAPSAEEAHGHDHDHDGTRLTVGVEGGVVVLDAESLEVIDTLASESFVRLNNAGDGQHVFVTTSAGFQVLDTAEPELTDLVFPAATAGHVVRHAGTTVLYDDATSDSVIFDTDALLEADGMPSTTVIDGVEAHHGVSIVLTDGTFLTTVGTADGRTGAVALDASGAEITRSDECPGVHGEGTTAGEVVVFGCDDGVLVYKDGAFTKLDAGVEYGRTGNAYVSETSPIMVGDYKNDRDAEGYLLTSVVLVDTEAMTHRVVELPEGVAYTFRDIARGPGDLAYILSADGAVHVLDPSTGELVDAFPVVAPWESPAQWQDAHPAIVVDGDIAYVTEPAVNGIHALDLTTGKIVATVTLDAAPNELALATHAH